MNIALTEAAAPAAGSRAPDFSLPIAVNPGADCILAALESLPRKRA
jgi:hypothetical protein